MASITIITLLLPLYGAAAQSSVPTPEAPSTVSILLENNRHSLIVNGKPFTVKGVGMGYVDAERIALLAAAGGNAFRTWGTDKLELQLAAAKANGLMVLVGLDVRKELQGFDYNDETAIARQHESVIAVINKYKDHPSLLGWIIANEPNLLIGSDGQLKPANPKVYDAIGAIVAYIHKHDTNHPATIAFAFTPSLAQDIQTALKRVDSLDFISFQAYGALPAIPGFVKEQSIDHAFMVTEYGPLGHWEMPATAWGREIEEPSGVKAAGIVARSEPTLHNDTTGHLIGSFAFLWGQKQERTPTWYGMFISSGERTSIVDELTLMWTGEYPTNRAPSAWSISIDKKQATESVHLLPDQHAVVRIDVDDPEGDPIETRWELMTEVLDRSQGGHAEVEPVRLAQTFESAGSGDDYSSATFVAPAEPGEYRLFAYVFDGHGGVATANFPFEVKLETN